MDHLDELCGLGARGSAHVEDLVVRLDLEKKGWDHADSLLPADVALLRLLHKERVELLQLLALADKLPWCLRESRQGVEERRQLVARSEKARVEKAMRSLRRVTTHNRSHIQV